MVALIYPNDGNGRHQLGEAEAQEGIDTLEPFVGPTSTKYQTVLKHMQTSGNGCAMCPEWPPAPMSCGQSLCQWRRSCGPSPNHGPLPSRDTTGGMLLLISSCAIRTCGSCAAKGVQNWDTERSSEAEDIA